MEQYFFHSIIAFYLNLIYSPLFLSEPNLDTNVLQFLTPYIFALFLAKTSSQFNYKLSKNKAFYLRSFWRKQFAINEDFVSRAYGSLTFYEILGFLGTLTDLLCILSFVH
jgi:hypothetical protein